MMGRKLKRGGPDVCKRPCVECGPRHHYSDALMEDAEGSPDHPAAKAGCDVWYVCKHCGGWKEARL